MSIGTLEAHYKDPAIRVYLKKDLVLPFVKIMFRLYILINDSSFNFQ